MKYNQLADTGIQISAITFGAWAIGGWMWGGADKQDALDALHKSLELGITSIDTAPVYGQGLSEEIVGEALKGKRHEAQILTKYGMRWDVERPGDFMASKDNNGKDRKS